MAKRGCFASTKHTLILRSADGEKINGTGSTGDLEYTKNLARSILRMVVHVASVDVHHYDPAVSWQTLQPVAIITLDDEEGEQ